MLTNPDLGHVKRDLLSVLHTQHGALHHVDRVDRLVFPLLTLPKHSLYLTEPPFSDSHTVQTIETLVDSVIRKARELVENVGEYTEVLGKRQENIVMELKKHTYIKQNEHLLEDSGSESEQDQPAVVMDDAQSLDSKVSKIASKLSLHKQTQASSKPKGKQMPEFPPGAETLLRSLDIDREIFK